MATPTSVLRTEPYKAAYVLASRRVNTISIILDARHLTALNTVANPPLKRCPVLLLSPPRRRPNVAYLLVPGARGAAKPTGQTLSNACPTYIQKKLETLVHVTVLQQGGLATIVANAPDLNRFSLLSEVPVNEVENRTLSLDLKQWATYLNRPNVSLESA